jgi:hypothetical protein
MKKAILILAILLISVFMSSTVYAGTLNVYEMEIVSAARAKYEYQGVDYIVKSEYIDELINYLAADGMDLTAEERDQVLQKAFASVARGVEEGYMVPLEDELTNGQNNPVDSQNEAVDSTESNSEAANADNADEQIISDSDASTPVDTVKKILTDQGRTQVPEDRATSTSDPNIIKDTGFDLSNTIFISIGIGVLMIIGMIVTIKYNFFAHKNE